MSGVLRTGGSNVPRWKWDTTDISNGQNYTEITNDSHTHLNQNHKTTASGGSIQSSASGNIVDQAGGNASYSAGGSLFAGGSSTHIHGQIIAEPINLGHFNKTAFAAALRSNELHLLGDTVEDSGMTMTTSTSRATPPSIPDLGVPYDGFRWIDTTSGIEYSYYGGIWAEGGGAIPFPASPSVGQVYALNNRQWRWNAIGWEEVKTKTTDVRSVSGAVTVAVDKITTLTATGFVTVTLTGNSGQFGILVFVVGGTGTTYNVTFANGIRIGGGTGAISISSGTTAFRVWHDGANIYYSYG